MDNRESYIMQIGQCARIRVFVHSAKAVLADSFLRSKENNGRSE
jgi:hypothetical protein